MSEKSHRCEAFTRKVSDMSDRMRDSKTMICLPLLFIGL